MGLTRSRWVELGWIFLTQAWYTRLEKLLNPTHVHSYYFIYVLLANCCKRLIWLEGIKVVKICYVFLFLFCVLFLW